MNSEQGPPETGSVPSIRSTWYVSWWTATAVRAGRPRRLQRLVVLAEERQYRLRRIDDDLSLAPSQSSRNRREGMRPASRCGRFAKYTVASASSCNVMSPSCELNAEPVWTNRRIHQASDVRAFAINTSPE